uniref:Uncharacterized protein n=1 Tax=Periophthalmus magnuspinnatus TaxID=409849 RepID=A0A3B3ZSF9_9GOBI
MLSGGGRNTLRIFSIPPSCFPWRKQRLGTRRWTRSSPWLKSPRWLASSSVSGRAPGVDEIRPAYLRSLDVVGLFWLTSLGNIAWWSGTVPLDWQTGVVVLLYQKGDWRVCSNYRGITLLSLSGKVHSRILERRIRPIVEPRIQEEQCCFHPGRRTLDQSASRHDDVLRMVLTQMEGEHKLALRRVYASALPPLVDRCGITVCRHLKRLERVILEYLELSDPPDETSRIHILLTLNQTLQTAWPRVNQRRGQQLLKAVLRLLVDVSSDINLKDSVKREIFDQSAASIRLLDVCSNRTLQVLKYMY